MHHYWGFGLTIASEIEFPELLPYEHNGLPDLTISIGIVPNQLTGDAAGKKVCTSANTGEYLLNLLSIAKYYATGGNSIVVEPLAAADDKSIRLFLLNSVMSAILKQRDMVALNAAGIQYQDGVILFLGRANVGKSTIISQLEQKGYPIFCDEACILQPGADGQISVLPSYPAVNLWADTFEQLAKPLPPEADKLRPQLPKYALRYHQGFNIIAKPVKQLFVLNDMAITTPVEVKKLSPVEAFSETHNNIFYRKQIYPMKKEAVHFLNLSKLTKDIPAYLITRTIYRDTFEEMAQLIENQIHYNG
jgi:hypothetical protein